MAGAGKKTFTAGEVLTASDVNTYLMEQSVMYFGGTAARSSAIPTPSTGMTTYIGTTGTASIPQIETYTGSAWQTPYGLTLVASTTVSGASSIQINNCFTSAYTNYRIIMDFVGSGNNFIFSRLSASGTPLATSTYQYASRYWDSAAGSGAAENASGQGQWVTGYASTTGSQSVLDFTYPAVALPTLFTGMSAQGSTAVQRTGHNSNSTAYDGYFVLPNGVTLTGTIRIYGYRNA
jgi:hypothetical protein